MTINRLRGALSLGAFIACLAPGVAHAQVSDSLYAELKRIGQIVDPACTAKAMRPLMPKNDYNTWWAPGAAAPDPSKAKLYPGVTIARDQKFGPHDKDLVDIFTADNKGSGKTVFMWVPGGGGNKIEQQVREGNAFYDNIGRWGVKNGLVVVTVQRHQGQAWDDAGRDIAAAVDWVKANIAQYGGDPNKIVMGAHSAGTGPTGVYVGHPERWPNGVQVKGMVYMSGGAYAGNYPGAPAAPAGGGRGPNAGAADAPRPGAACGSTAAQNGTDGAISGPSGVTPQPARAGGPGGPGGPGGRGGQQLTDAERAERDNWPAFSKTPVHLMFVRAELDPGVMGDMTATDKGMHNALCQTEGAGAKDGQGRCPVMLYAKRNSHMSEVFSFDSPDKSVANPVLAFIKNSVKDEKGKPSTR